MNREVRLARSMILEAILIGVMLARDDDAKEVADAMAPGDMTSVTGKQMVESILDGDRRRFSKIIHRRYGVRLNEGERAVPAILRTVKLRNASEAMRSMSAAIAEQVRDTDEPADVMEQWEEGMTVLRRMVELLEKQGPEGTK